jgi:hypothetical protein
VSYHEWRAAQELLRLDPPFYALIMAAIHRADTLNTEKLRAAWPDVWAETFARYHAPGGLLDGERVEP